jgi:hypothetical protein
MNPNKLKILKSKSKCGKKLGLERFRKSKLRKKLKQRREDGILRREESKQRMKDKYGNDDWIQLHTKEVYLERLKRENEVEDIIKDVEREILQIKTSC